MPNGRFRPCAKTSTLAAVVPSAEGRRTFTRPVCVSVSRMSPFGAKRIARGACTLLVNTSTLKPSGTDSFAFAGLSTSFGKLAAEGVSNGTGRLATSMRCTRPGTSFFQSASPFGGPALGGGASPGGGPNRGRGASLNVPSFTAWKYAIRFWRSSGFGTGMTIADPGTTVVGEVRKVSSDAASQVRFELCNAFV